MGDVLRDPVLQPEQTSAYKPEAMADYFFHSDRCAAFADVVPADVLRHVAVNYTPTLQSTYRPTISADEIVNGTGALLMAPELVSALRYTGGATGLNNIGETENFCRSCQVYEHVYEVESCTVDEWGDDPVLKLVFTTRSIPRRRQPATWAKDPPTWSSVDGWPAAVTALNAEAYRTLDNALREYAIHRANPHYQCKFFYELGDTACQAVDPDVFGSCYPKFHFIKLIPEPYEDDNDVLDAHDARCVVDDTSSLRCICTRSARVGLTARLPPRLFACRRAGRCSTTRSSGCASRRSAGGP